MSRGCECLHHISRHAFTGKLDIEVSVAPPTSERVTRDNNRMTQTTAHQALPGSSSTRKRREESDGGSEDAGSNGNRDANITGIPEQAFASHPRKKRMTGDAVKSRIDLDDDDKPHESNAGHVLIGPQTGRLAARESLDELHRRLDDSRELCMAAFLLLEQRRAEYRLLNERYRIASDVI